MPKPELLETFDNPYADRDYEIHMDCTEFTSLCPLGGVESDAEELRLALCRATQRVIARCLDLVGVEAPERM